MPGINKDLQLDHRLGETWCGFHVICGQAGDRRRPQKENAFQEAKAKVKRLCEEDIKMI